MPIVFVNQPLTCLFSRTSPGRLLGLDPSRELVHLALALAFDAEQGTPARHARLHVAGRLHAKLLLYALPALFEIISHAPTIPATSVLASRHRVLVGFQGSERPVRLMLYPYMTFADGTEVVHSGIMHEGDADKVFVHFERPTEKGFDSARCELPSYAWTQWEGGFTEAERIEFEDFLRNNAHLLYRYAASGGVKVA